MSLPSPETRSKFQSKMKLFVNDFLKLPGATLEEQCDAFVELANKNGPKWLLYRIYNYREHYERLIEEGKIEASTVANYLHAVKSFCDKNDDSMPTLSKSKWAMIRGGLPQIRLVANVRAPTDEEIRKLLNFSQDIRLKPIVLIILSSGVREGTFAYQKNGHSGKWKYLLWGDVTRIPEDEDLPIQCAKIRAYNEEIREEYDAFITPEAYNAILEYLELRRQDGEVITAKSPVIRNQWKTTNVPQGARRFVAKYQKAAGYSTIKKLVNYGWINAGVRDPLPRDPVTNKLIGKRRHEFKMVHGLRMYFSSIAEPILENRDIVRMLLGQGNPMDESYRDPKAKEKMLLKHYLKLVPALTISDVDKEALQAQVAELTEAIDNAQRIQQEEIAKLRAGYERLEQIMTTVFKISENGEEKFRFTLGDPSKCDKELKFVKEQQHQEIS